MQNPKMAFLIISVIIVRNSFADVAEIKSPRAAVSPKDEFSLVINSFVFNGASDRSIDTAHISLNPDTTELASNSMFGVTNRTTIRIENPLQITTMKCDVFGSEKSSSKKLQSLQDPTSGPESRDLRLRRSLTSRRVEMQVCVKDGVLSKLYILEKFKGSTNINCTRLNYRHGIISLNNKIKIHKFGKEWCCSGLANTPEFWKNEARKYLGFKIFLDSTGINEIANDTFENVPSLSDVSLSSNNLTDAKIVANLPTTIRRLVLSKNAIDKIETNTFSKFRELLYLDLKDNRITIVQPGAFENNFNLQEIDLDENCMTRLAVGVFTGLPALQRLSLSYNMLTTVSSGVFDLTGLTSLDISHNGIEIIESGAFKSSGEGELHRHFHLDISYNPIVILKNGAFYGLSKNPSCGIAMEHTRIEVIEGGLFDEISV